MKRRVRFTVKNFILMILLAINFIIAFYCGAMLDIELMWIPLIVGGIAFGFMVLFYFANKDLIEDLYN